MDTYEIYREDKQAGATSLSLLTVTKDNHAPIHEKQALVAEGTVQSALGMAALNVTGQVNPNTMQLPAFCKQHAAPGQGHAPSFNLAEYLQGNFNGFRL